MKMKKFKLLFISLLLIMCICVFVACDKNSNDNIIRAELVQKDYAEFEYRPGKLLKYYETEYIKIWFDEEWFGKDIYVQIFDGTGQTLLNTITNSRINAQRLSNSGHSGYDIVPNTYFYIDDLQIRTDDGYSGNLTGKFDTVVLRICYDKESQIWDNEGARNEIQVIQLAEYIIGFKQSEYIS